MGGEWYELCYLEVCPSWPRRARVLAAWIHRTTIIAPDTVGVLPDVVGGTPQSGAATPSEVGDRYSSRSDSWWSSASDS